MNWKQGGVNASALWKKYRLVILVILAGVLLMLLPADKGSNIKPPADESSGREDFSLDATCRQMEDILSRIKGTGQLRLMLTLKSGSQLQLAEDTDRSDAEKETHTDRSTVTLSRGGGTEEIVVTRRTYPVYRGAVVVCEGADNAEVRLALT